MNTLPVQLHEYAELIRVIWPSLLAAAALAVAGGTLGLFVILRRESLVALTMPQIVTLGAAVAMRFGWPTLPIAMIAVAAAMLLLARSRRSDSSHFLLPALYVGGLCVSILLVANAGAELVQVQNMFTGIDVAVEPIQSLTTTVILLIAALVCAALWRRWLLLAQAPAVAELSGLNPVRHEALFLFLLAIVLVIGTNTSGAVLVIAMIFLPAAAVLPWTRRIPPALAASVVAGLVFLVLGFVISNELNWPLSQSVGGAGVAVFLLSHLLAGLLR